MGNKILYNSDEAAQIKTVTGWVSSTGTFWGNNEHMARYDGSTHKICECGNEMTKGYTICDSCQGKKNIERYNAMPFKEWDGKTPLCLFHDDQYFFHDDEIEMYLEDNGIEAKDLKLVICEPQHLHEINPDIWEDVWPEDAELPKEVEDALNALNKVISKQDPFSWIEGKYRTDYNPEIFQREKEINKIPFS